MILQHLESVGQGHSSSRRSLYAPIPSLRCCCQRSIASLVGPILKYISLENIQIYMEKLYFMMMTMSRLWVDF